MAFASSRIGAQAAIIKPCDLCEDDENVNWFCKDCNQNLCDRCKMLHFRSNVSKSHIVLSISEGFGMEKRNLSNICREHDELFTFFCKTCDRYICSKCLSKEHKTHDFVHLLEIESDLQKQLDDVIKEKEIEKQKMTINYDELTQYENQSEDHLKEQCTKIDDILNAIKMVAEEETGKLRGSLGSIIHQQDEEVKEGKQKIQTQTEFYSKEIQTVQQERRHQSASTLIDFTKESINKLKKLKPMFIEILDNKPLHFEEQLDENQIQEAIENLLGTQKLSYKNITRESYGTNCKALSKLEIIRKVSLHRIKHCRSMCLSPDGGIWIGAYGCVYKMSSDFITVLHQIPDRKKSLLSCDYIACLQSGDAVVSYGYLPYVDRFTSDGKRVEFTHIPALPPFKSHRSTYDIAVNVHDEVVINVDGKSIVVYSNDGTELREFQVDGGIKTFFTDRDGCIIVAHPRLPDLTILDGGSGEVKTSWETSISDINRLTYDSYGNVLIRSMKKHVYFLSNNGEVQETFIVDCDEIIGVCLNEEDHLLILVCKMIDL